MSIENKAMYFNSIVNSDVNYLEHIHATLKNINNLNETAEKLESKGKHYYVNVVRTPENKVVLEAKRGGKHTSFANLKKFVNVIKEDPLANSELKQSILKEYKKIELKYTESLQRGGYFRRLFCPAPQQGKRAGVSPILVKMTLDTMTTLNEANRKAEIDLRYRIGVKKSASGEREVSLVGKTNKTANFANVTTLLEEMINKEGVNTEDLKAILEDFNKIKTHFEEAKNRLKNEKGWASKIVNYFTLRSMEAQLKRADDIVKKMQEKIELQSVNPTTLKTAEIKEEKELAEEELAQDLQSVKLTVLDMDEIKQKIELVKKEIVDIERKISIQKDFQELDEESSLTADHLSELENNLQIKKKELENLIDYKN